MPGLPGTRRAHAVPGICQYGARARGPTTPFAGVTSVFRPHHRHTVDAGAAGWLALLRRHVLAALALKLALLAVLFLLFFSAAHRPSPGPAAVSELLHLPG